MTSLGEKTSSKEPEVHDVSASEDGDSLIAPTEEEQAILRKVPGPISGTGYWLCIVEFAERASYYGCKQVFSNFIQFPLPKGGNGAGAPPRNSETNAGALGKGLQTSSALTTLFTFLAYAIPILGGYVADTHLGRYKTICLGILICGIAHIIMVFGALPSVLQAGNGLPPFIISLLVLAFGSGMFKCNIFPTVIDQIEHHEAYVKTTKKGERVIVDPEASVNRVTITYYALINVGAFFGLATTYCERRVGYWLAYLIPCILYLITPIVLGFAYKKTVKVPPQGSVIADSFRVIGIALKRNKWRGFGRSGYLDAAKPSVMASEGLDIAHIRWNDAFVEDVSRTLNACEIFLLFPIYNLNDSGIGNVQTNQAAFMTKGAAPNDLLNNFNPLAIIVMSPILNYGFYPLLRHFRIHLGPVKRIITGFIIASIGSMIGAIIQWRIYKTSPCGWHASTCDGVSPISVWWEIPIYWLSGTSELFANTTSYEIAYARSPTYMKGLVMALCLFSSAISAAISEACSAALVDPYLIWPFAAPAVAGVITAGLMWVWFRDLEKEDFLRKGSADEVRVALEQGKGEHSSAIEKGEKE